tara:strand:+ start:134 stop:280 length:147 start_codon:yes stop_codon:yes gene_type:complete
MIKYLDNFIALCLIVLAIATMGVVVLFLSVYYILEMIIDKFINWIENE